MSLRRSTRTNFRIQFKQSAYEDFKALDGSLKKRVAAQLLKIQANPMVGDPCGNKYGMDLTGYRKIYAAKKTYRIVWGVRADKLVVVVLGIGRRDKLEVYQRVFERLSEPEVNESGKPDEGGKPAS